MLLCVLPNSEVLPSLMKGRELKKLSLNSGQNVEIVKKDNFFPESQKYRGIERKFYILLDPSVCLKKQITVLNFLP